MKNDIWVVFLCGCTVALPADLYDFILDRQANEIKVTLWN